MGLKKLFKKTRKALGLPALTLGTAAKLGAAVATGGVGAGALALGAGALKSKLKSAAVSGIKQVVRSKAQKAILAKARAVAKPSIVPISAGTSKPPAQTMPGGAPLVKPRLVKPRKVAAAKPKKARTATNTGSKGKRTPPKGGKDLKAIAAKWRAAGKPGKWIDYVKAN